MIYKTIELTGEAGAGCFWKKASVTCLPKGIVPESS